MTATAESPENNAAAPQPLHSKVRDHLKKIAPQRMPITCAELAQTLQLAPANTIHQVALALETLMEEDAAAGHPLISALVISRARGGLPAPGFFDCARRVVGYAGTEQGTDAHLFHAEAFEAAVRFWGKPLETAVYEIDVHGLARMRAEGTAHTVLDIREPVELAICAIQDCVTLPMQQLPHNVETLPHHEPLIVLCHHGIRSAMVTEFLRNNGFDNAWNLAGGIDAWSRLIEPDLPRY